MKNAAPEPFDFRFRRLLGGKVLLTNDSGAGVVLKEADFSRFVSGRLGRGPAELELGAKGFIRNRMDMAGVAAALAERFFSGWKGPHVHIVSLNARCNLNCVYCGAGAGSAVRKRMTRAVAEKTLDLIFSVPAPALMLEFQGGEPLLDFKTLKFMVTQARKRAAELKRNISFSVVTNLSLMDSAKMEFILSNDITVCASLDGPAALHNANRPSRGASAHRMTVKWLKVLIKKGALRPGFETPNAICTVTRASLGLAREIVDEYARLGIMRVQLGPLDPLGRALAAWPALGYSPEEFLKFYRSALSRILELNGRGVSVYEKGILIFIKQIFGQTRPRYQNLDLVYRLAYNWDGGIYGSDEARMLSNSGDVFFRLGSVSGGSFAGLLQNPMAKFLMRSCFNSLCQPACARCAYSAYCRTSPVYNYLAQKNPWGNMVVNERCAVYKGVLDLLFELSLNKKNMVIFRKWDEMYG